MSNTNKPPKLTGTELAILRSTLQRSGITNPNALIKRYQNTSFGPELETPDPHSDELLNSVEAELDARKGYVQISPSENVSDCSTGRCNLPGPARGGYQDPGFDDELSDLLTSNGKEKAAIPTVTSLLPLPIKITDRALEMGHLVGPMTLELSKRSLEVGGFFTTDLTDGDFSLTDFIIPKGLPVTTGSILVAEHYPEAAFELKELNDAQGTKRRLSAMFHVHPFSHGLHHSIPDDKALESLVNKMAEVNRISSEAPYALIESKVRKEYGEDRLVLRGDDLSDAIVKFVYPNDEAFFKLLQDFGLKPQQKGFNKREFLAKLLDTIDHTTTEPRTIRFATSFVFDNERKGPYVKMEIEEKFGLSGKVETYFLENPKLQVIRKGENLPTADEVRKLITERVKFPEVQTFLKKVKGWGKGKKGQTFVAPVGGVISDEDWDSVVGRGEYAGAYPATGGTWAAPVGGTYKAPTPALVEKVDFAKVPIDDVATTFALQATAYVAQFSDKRCRYSHFLNKILDKAGEYVTSYGTSNPPQSGSRGNLRKHVLDLGKLAEDAEKGLPADIKFYRINNVGENIANYLAVNPDALTMEFMIRFTEAADIYTKNRLIKLYVDKVNQESAEVEAESLKNTSLTKLPGGEKKPR